MKYAIMLTLFLLSCTKENKTCWECKLTGTVTPYEETRQVCNDGEQPGPFKDANGNDLNSNCKKK